MAGEIVGGKNKGRLQKIVFDKFNTLVQPLKNGIVAIISENLTAEIQMWVNAIIERVHIVPQIIPSNMRQFEKEFIDILELMKID